MEKKVFGIPVVVMVLVLSIIVPILVGEYLSYRALNKTCPKPVVTERIVYVTPTVLPTASPSATLVPTKRVVRPTVVVPTIE